MSREDKRNYNSDNRQTQRFHTVPGICRFGHDRFDGRVSHVHDVVILARCMHRLAEHFDPLANLGQALTICSARC